MEIKTLIEVIEPKRDQLIKENEEILSQIDIMVKVLERRKKRYEENAQKIDQYDNIINGKF